MRAIIFDMDGVLVNCQEVNYVAWRSCLSRYGVGLDRESFEDYYGLKGDEIIRRAVDSDLSEEEVKRIREEKNQEFLNNKDEIDLLEGVEHLLNNLKDEYKLGVATSASNSRARHILKKTGIEEYFEAVNTSADITNGKPDPEIFSKTIDDLSENPEDCTVIEDSPYGVSGAKKAGAAVIGVATTCDANELTEANKIFNHPKNIDLNTFK